MTPRRNYTTVEANLEVMITLKAHIMKKMKEQIAIMELKSKAAKPMGAC